MHITGTNHRGKEILDSMDILYAFASDDDVYVNTIDDEYKVHIKLYDLCEHPQMIRINKSEVINVTKIKDAAPLFNSRIRISLTDGTVLYVNRTYIKKFKAYLIGGIE